MRSLLPLLIFLFLNKPLQAQSYFYNDEYFDPEVLVEAGIGIGIMNCLTDLGGKSTKARAFLRDLHWENSRPAVSVYTSALYNYKIGVRLELSIGSISAADSLSKDAGVIGKTRFDRNLHFRSSIKEASVVFEIHPLSFFAEDQRSLLSPYLLGGIGFFHFDPKARLHGQWYSLSAHHTEGQNFDPNRYPKPYALWQWNVPLGFGLGCDLFAKGYLRMEFLYRFLRTDHLDDVSERYVDAEEFYRWLDPETARIAIQLSDRRIGANGFSAQGTRRGNNKKNDGYLSIQLKFGWVLNRTKR